MLDSAHLVSNPAVCDAFFHVSPQNPSPEAFLDWF